MAQIAHRTGQTALGPKSGFATAKPSVLTVARRVVATWVARRHGRIALSQLTPAQLHDIGLDEVTAAEEARRPFWHP